ncbi:M20/M25/M40 family metallo-hydrolase [Thermoflavifilum thermophilum]|uniref:Peptidase family M28 n=1 Tax=Thermoflavifilum thermophilum TaxID=1393122 RepID=A0A1I7N7F2_9BACT|nr:M20/M25/M40 family metallo-hydrolase [Thermoflavifilum thermophilum]SFV30523.1 Peptidase family M28 [Thermoflavifilum thermophilum]
MKIRNLIPWVFVLWIGGTWPQLAGGQSFPARDPIIEKSVQQVSADSLRAYVQTLVSFGTRHTLSTENDPHRGIGAARRWVEARLQEYSQRGGNRLRVEEDRWMLTPGERVPFAHPIANIIATLPGTDTSDHRIFMASAHLDSRRSNVLDSIGDAPGADDDGSGVAALLEIARIIANQHFPATIKLVFFSGEEQGLYGSRHLAERAASEGWQIAALLNNDIIGQTTASETGLQDNTRVRVFSETIPAAETPEQARMRRMTNGDNDSPSRELARYLYEIARAYIPNLDVVLIYRPDRFLRGGDHLPFQQKGYTAVRLTEYYENFNHQHQDIRVEKGIHYGDLPEYMDFEYLRKNTALNLATLISLAKSPAAPAHAWLSAGELGNETTLRWMASASGHPAGYRVLMRDTDQPLWQQAFYTTDTTLTLPYSKDNVFFAVQAIGANGDMSLPVFPEISR